MKVVLIFLLGVAILIGAIILNVLASYSGLLSWFEFLKNPQKAGVASYVWLFIIYPLGLGLIAYFAYKLLNLS
ncbi:MAG: hypothetical protein COT81_05880 [Candidatus Buchananbacteria bacterium CG10_big_fil_rev_8_21_14_0_10_42_9]|uniref:Uncharacterized protein n=1 Tax=Candidatus Buchananbacteria bacterium CG10_big_fil_rev_8_21_14_0_10_42_9 TaxID=1974526 RepID=A0A2H0VZN9_9BACT|nr:MAG: hypothetical protein COT81_05880 [Candidatus Buchananbacteria bacterium CG10_big_fil_rev_8_21_14_0_10_42_9]